jgi:hypothetical protein
MFARFFCSSNTFLQSLIPYHSTGGKGGVSGTINVFLDAKSSIKTIKINTTITTKKMSFLFLKVNLTFFLLSYIISVAF